MRFVAPLLLFAFGAACGFGAYSFAVTGGFLLTCGSLVLGVLCASAVWSAIMKLDAA